MQELITLGKKIYDMNNAREVRRMVTFVVRAALHRTEMQGLFAYFAQDDLRKSIIAGNPFPFEQVTRSFFYKNSTFVERGRIIEGHVDFLRQKVQPAWVRDLCICDSKGYAVWQEEYEDKKWEVVVNFEPGQRKEGLLSLTMNLGQEHLYQIVFWFAKDKAGEDSLWIGAMQGPNMENARDVVKRITKRCFTYRTKNLILYMTQAVARSLGIRHIYAVTNDGYYANNHMRADRKLKTSFSDFWAEAGGKPCTDKRFYELPLVEPRKTMEEVPTRKRNVYRKRFVFLDEVDARIEAAIKKILK